MASIFFPLEIHELRRPDIVHVQPVRWFTSIKDLKDQLRKRICIPSSRMHLYHSSSSKSLRNQTTLHDLGIDGPGHMLRLALNSTSTSPQYSLIHSQDVELDDYCKDILYRVRLGFNHSQLPSKTDMLDCTGGVYFMKESSGLPIAVFKPSDEEQGMPNNPKGHAGNGSHGLRPFLKPGEGYIRETAAYILDFNNFSHVPPTTIVHCEHSSFHYSTNNQGITDSYPKLGSLQKFIPAGDTFEDISYSMVGVLELQKIALLDMRLLNCDRNASNILAIRRQQPLSSRYARQNNRSGSISSTVSEDDRTEGSERTMTFDEFIDAPLNNTSFSTKGADKVQDFYELIPIDHGYCIPSQLHIDEFDWAWFHCPQIAMEVHPEIKKYINSIDIEELLTKLTNQISLPESCLFLLRLVHKLLVDGINSGLTLRDIAALIARTDEDVPSPLENVLLSSEENAYRALEMRSNRLNSRPTSERDGKTSVEASPLRSKKGEDFSSCRVHSVDQVPAHCAKIRKVVNSELSLQNMDPEQKLLSLRIPTPDLHEHSGYLSSENIQKLQQSPSLLSLPYRRRDSVQCRNGYFMTDLSEEGEFPVDEQQNFQHVVTGVVLGLGKQQATTARPGDALVSLRTMDSSMDSRGPYFSSGPATSTRMNMETVNAPGTFESDFTSSEASSYELGTSPRSFTDNFVSQLYQKSVESGSLQQSPNPQQSVPSSPMSEDIYRQCDVNDSLKNLPQKDAFGNHQSGHTSTANSNQSSKRGSPTELLTSTLGASGLMFPIGLEAVSMQRVVSFGAFESPPIYDMKKSERQISHLRREKRKKASKSQEFEHLRLVFAEESTASMIGKELKMKQTVK